MATQGTGIEAYDLIWRNNRTFRTTWKFTADGVPLDLTGWTELQVAVRSRYAAEPVFEILDETPEVYYFDADRTTGFVHVRWDFSGVAPGDYEWDARAKNSLGDWVVFWCGTLTIEGGDARG